MRIAFGEGLSGIIGLFMTLVICSRTYAQNDAESSASLMRDIALSSYRQLLLPVEDLHLRTELAISAEQYSVFRDYFNKHRSSFPPFSILVDSEKGVSKFLQLGEKGIREADAPFELFFDEALLPIQSDKLLGMHLIEHGLIGFKHPAMKTRFELSDTQVTEIENVIAENQRLRQETWTSGVFLKNGKKDIAFDLLEHNRLSMVSKVLFPKQREALLSILSITPQQTRQRLSLGF